MRVLTPEAMREIDRRAIEEAGIPGLVLMENAALGVVEAIADLYPDAEEVAIFCGSGNNGGDGLAVARHLDVRGYEVTVWLAAGGRELSGDAAAQLRICRYQGIEVLELDEEALATVAGEAAMLKGSLGTVEVSIAGDSATRRWGVGRGEGVRIGGRGG